VSRRLGLLALWAVFAAAAVGVGFAAAGLVGDPFTDPGDEAVSLVEAGAPPRGGASVPVPSASATPSGSGPGSGSAAPPARDDVVRSVTTRAGVVSGSCSGGLVTISAAPAVGWQVDELDGGPDDDADVKLEQRSGGGEVEVGAACRDGVPRFAVDDSADDDHSGRGGGGSGSGSGGSGSSGGGPGPG
jgi:hypothetical protein